MRGSSHPINSGGARLRRQCQAWVLLATILAFPFNFIERQKLRRLNCSNDRPDKRLTVAPFCLSAARLSKALEIIPRLPFYVVTGVVHTGQSTRRRRLWSGRFQVCQMTLQISAGRGWKISGKADEGSLH
jgi:hypothetical protein